MPRLRLGGRRLTPKIDKAWDEQGYRDSHAGQLYEVTGPRLWTFAEAIGEIATVTGRALRFVQVGVHEYASALEKAEAPRTFVTLITYLFTEALDGRNASVEDGVRRALGRPARDFSEYVRAATATGVWTPNARERTGPTDHAA